MAPVERRDGEAYDALWDELRGSGFTRVRVDGRSVSLDEPPKLSHRRKHRLEVVVDRAIVRRADPLAAGRLGRVGARPGQGSRPRRPGRRRQGRAAMARRPLQPAPQLRRLRPELRGAVAAPLLVQQPARLVPGLRGPGHAARRQPRRAHPRRPQESPRRRGRRLARLRREPGLRPADRGPGRGAGDRPRHAVRRARRPPPPRAAPRHRRDLVYRARRQRAARVLVPVQGPLPGDRGGGAGLVHLSLQASGDGRRRPLRRLHGGAAPRRRRRRPVPRLDPRPDRPVAAGPGLRVLQGAEARAATSGTSPATWSARSATASSSWSTSGSTTCRSPAARRRSRGARASGSAWRARSAAA